MKYSIMAYKDNDINAFNPPFAVALAKEDAIEQIDFAARKHQVKEQDSTTVFYLGEFDTATGQIKLSEQPEQVLDLRKYGVKA